MQILCQQSFNLKAAPQNQHHHECKNCPADLAPNYHICEHCGTVFTVEKGQDGYMEHEVP